MSDDVVVIGFGAETSGIQEGNVSLENLAVAGDKADKAIGALEETTKKTGRSLADLGKGGADFAESMGLVRRATAGISDDAKKAAEGISSTGEAAEHTKISLDGYKNALELFGFSTKKVTEDHKRMVDALVNTNFTEQERKVIDSLGEQSLKLRSTAGEWAAFKMAQKGMSDEAQLVASMLADQNAKLGASSSEFSKLGNNASNFAARLGMMATGLRSGNVSMASLATSGARLGMSLATTVPLIGGAVAAVGLLAAAYYKGSREADELRKSIALTGNAAGTTVSQLSDMSREIGNIEGISQNKAAGALAEMVRHITSGADALQSYTVAAIKWEQATGESVQNTAKAFQRLQEEPLKAAVELNKSINFLTVSTYDQIKALEEQGKTTEAAKVASDSYANTIENRAGSITENLGHIERFWRDIKNATNDAANAALNYGRAKSDSQRLESLYSEQSRLTSALNNKNMGGWLGSLASRHSYGDSMLVGSHRNDAQTELNAVNNQIRRLEAKGQAEQVVAQIDAQEKKSVQAAVEIDKIRDSLASKEERRLEERKKIYALFDEKLKSHTLSDKDRAEAEAQMQKMLDAVDKKYKEKKGGTDRLAGVLNQDENRLAQLQAEIAQLESYDGAVEKLTKGQLELAVVQQHLKEGTDLYGKALTDKTRAQLEAHEANLNEIVDAELYKGMLEDQAKATEAAKKAADNWLSSMQQSNESLQAQVDAHGKSKLAIEQEKLARMQSAQAIGKQIEIGKQMVTVTDDMTEAQRQHIALMKELESLAWNDALDKEIFAAQKQLELGNEELRLVGMTGLERAKVVALRKVEFEYAKKLNDLEIQLRNKAIDQAEFNTRVIRLNEWKQIESSNAINKVIQDDFQKTADQINQSLTDALLRGFEGGKGFAKNFADTLKNMFKTMVLRPIISFIVQPIGNIVSSVISGVLGGGSGSGGGLGNLFNLGSNASSLFGIGTNSYGAAGYIGSMFGYGNAAGAGYGTLAYANAVGAMGGDSLGAFIAANNGWAGMAGAGGAGSSTLGAAGGWASSGMAAAGTIAIPLFVGMLAEMFDNEYTRHWGAASTSNYNPGVKPGSTRFDLTTGSLPDRDAVIAAINARMDKWLASPLGEDSGLTHITADDVSAISDRALAQFLNSGSGFFGIGRSEGVGAAVGDQFQNLIDLLNSYDNTDYYRGPGYVDPETRGWWGDFNHDPSLNDPRMIAASRQIATGIQSPIERLLRAVGQSTDDLLTEFGFAYESGKYNSVYGHLNITRGDQTLQDFGTIRDGDYSTHWHSMDEMFKAMYGAALDTFKNLDLPEYANTLVDAARAEMDKLTGDDVAGQAAALYESAANNIAATFTAIKQLIDIFTEFSQAAQDDVYAVGALMGGLQNLQGAFANYVGNFYTASERTAIGLAQVQAQFDTLGVSMPQSTAAFRELVNAQDLSTQSGRELFAQLLNLSGGFADMMNSLRESLGLTRDSLSGLISGVLQEAQSAQEAQQLGAQRAGDLFMDAIMSTMMSAVVDQMMAGLVDPLVMQITAGAAEAAAIQTAGAAAAADTILVGTMIGTTEMITASEAIGMGSLVAAEELATGGAFGAAALGAGASGAAEMMAKGGEAAGNNLLAGSSAAAQGLASVVDQAVATINAMTEIFSSEDFRAAYANFTQAIGDVSSAMFTARGSIGQSVGYVNNYTKAVASSGSAAEKAASDVSNAWKQIADSLMDEVRRIRGLIAESADQGLAYWQAQFAITTAQARAGDQDAAKELTSLSGNVLRAAELEAGSMLDLQRIRAEIAASLQETADRGYGFAGLDQGGESIAPTVQPVVQAINMQAVSSSRENEALRVEIAQLREEQKVQTVAMVEPLAQMARIMRKLDSQGVRLQEEEAVPA